MTNVAIPLSPIAPGMTHAVRPLSAVEAGRAFEAAMLEVFVAELLPEQPTEGAEGFGVRAGASAWHGMMAQTLADAIAARGGIGLGEAVTAAMATRTDG